MENVRPSERHLSGSTLESIDAFWRWFISSSEELKGLYQKHNFGELSARMGRALDRVHSDLAWEIGPGESAPFLLTISSEGNPSLRALADKMIEVAPALSGWEFYSSKPARKPPAAVRLVERGVNVNTQLWKFSPIDRPDVGRIDLTIIDEELANLADLDREAALKAVSIYLDQVLGEDTVEAWIGRFDICHSEPSPTGEAFEMKEIADYLYWATHREQDPIVQGGVAQRGPLQ